jgi:glyoxylase-like metal-dependent hydrolase (beta-lactamase superfamily II)
MVIMLGFKNPIKIEKTNIDLDDILRLPGGAALRKNRDPKPKHIYELLLPYSNGYLFYAGDDQWDLVDAGILRQDDPSLEERFQQLLEFSIRKIIITHNHFDHFAGVVHELKKRNPDIPVIAYQPPVKQKKPISDLHTGGNNYLANLYLNYFDITRDQITIAFDENLYKKEKIQIGQYDFQLIPTPGHSYDGVCFYNKRNKILISGDTLITNPIRIKRRVERIDRLMGAGPCITETGNADLLKKSLSKLCKIDFSFLLPGHGTVLKGKNLNKHLKNHLEQIWKESIEMHDHF